MKIQKPLGEALGDVVWTINVMGMFFIVLTSWLLFQKRGPWQWRDTAGSPKYGVHPSEEDNIKKVNYLMIKLWSKVMDWVLNFLELKNLNWRMDCGERKLSSGSSGIQWSSICLNWKIEKQTDCKMDCGGERKAPLASMEDLSQSQFNTPQQTPAPSPR